LVSNPHLFRNLRPFGRGKSAQVGANEPLTKWDKFSQMIERWLPSQLSTIAPFHSAFGTPDITAGGLGRVVHFVGPKTSYKWRYIYI